MCEETLAILVFISEPLEGRVWGRVPEKEHELALERRDSVQVGTRPAAKAIK